MCISCSEKENELKKLLLATEEAHRETVLNEEREYELKLEAELDEIEMEQNCEVKEVPRPASVHEFLLVVPANGPTSNRNEPTVVLEVVYAAPIKPVELCEPNQLPQACDRSSILSKRSQTSTMEAKDISVAPPKKTQIPIDYKHSVFSKNRRPHSSVKKRLIHSYKSDIDANTLSEGQLKRYCAICKILYSKSIDYQVIFF